MVVVDGLEIHEYSKVGGVWPHVRWSEASSSLITTNSFTTRLDAFYKD